MLHGRKFTRDSKTFTTALQWIAYFPQTLPVSKRRLLIDTVCDTFEIAEADLYATLSGLALPPRSNNHIDTEARLEGALPKGGWLEWYVNYTRRTESPLSYHLFSSLCVLGAALGRRVFKPKGFFNIYPNYCVVLVGPPARVAKTSAVNIADSLIRNTALCPVMADKATPEAIIQALMEKGGHQFFYCPELAVFLGKQTYNEGLTQLMLRLLDCPNQLTVRTRARGEETISSPITISMLAGTTMSLFANSTPDQVTSSGFLSRFLIVVENDTPREYPEPAKGSINLERNIQDTLRRLRDMQGEITYTPAATEWFTTWYHERKKRMREITEDSLAEAMSRFAVHLERTAMLIHLAEHDSFEVCPECFQTAKMLLDYVESKMPAVMTAIDKAIKSQDTDFILTTLSKLGGAADHSKLLRRCSSRMDAAMFKRHIITLTESNRLRQERRGALNFYILEEEV